MSLMPRRMKSAPIPTRNQKIPPWRTTRASSPTCHQLLGLPTQNPTRIGATTRTIPIKSSIHLFIMGAGRRDLKTFLKEIFSLIVGNFWHNFYKHVFPCFLMKYQRSFFKKRKHYHASFFLQRSRPLEALTGLLEEQVPDYDRIAKKYREMHGSEKMKLLHCYADDFRFLHWEMALEDLSEEHPELYLLKAEMPCEKKFIWHDSQRGIEAYFRKSPRENGGQPMASYEHFWTVHGIPTILESCHFPRLQERCNCGLYTLKSGNKINVLMREIKRSPGYIMISSRRNQTNPHQQYFLHIGGFLAFSSLSRKTFTEEVGEAVRKHGFPFLEESALPSREFSL